MDHRRTGYRKEEYGRTGGNAKRSRVKERTGWPRPRLEPGVPVGRTTWARSGRCLRPSMSGSPATFGGRIDLTPRLTGLWQGARPLERPVEERTGRDYLHQDWSLMQDVKLLVGTIDIVARAMLCPHRVDPPSMTGRTRQ